MFRSVFKTIVRGGSLTVLSKLLRWDLLIYVCYKTVRFVAVCYFIPSVCVSGVPTVHEPPEDGLKKRLKHVGASVKCFNVNLLLSKVYILCALVGMLNL